MTELIAPVSVVIPCFICSGTIERAVVSVISQTVLPSEIYLVDDASPDGGATVYELQRLAKKYSDIVSINVVLSEKNEGAGSARNRGWDLACQPYIAFLDSDDVWLPQKIEYQYNWMRKHPEYFLTCHKHVQIEEKLINSISGKFNFNNVQDKEIYKKELLFFNKIATRTVMLRSDIPYRFQEGKRYAEDYLLWLMILFGGFRATQLSLTLAATFKPDFGSNGLSSNLIKMEIGELTCYLNLYKIHAISFLLLLVLFSFSVMKFFRRLFLIATKKSIFIN